MRKVLLNKKTVKMQPDIINNIKIYNDGRYITQCYFSKSVKWFQKQFKRNYNLKDYTNLKQPLIIYGLYIKEDFKILNRHNSNVNIIWGGSDAYKLKSESANRLKSMVGIKHYATTKCISNQLNKFKIKNQVMPISPIITNDLKPFELGDNLYCYVGGNRKLYNPELAIEIAKKCNLKLILTNLSGKKYSRQQLIQVYKQCFMGLRLTPRDGIAATVIQMGLMGRRCIFNGDSPNSIKWNNIDDVCQSVMNQYNNRKNIDIYAIHNSVKEYLNISDQWMRV